MGIYRCIALHLGCGQNLNAKACFNLWHGLKGEVLLSLEDLGNILLAATHQLRELLLWHIHFFHFVQHHHSDALRVAEPRSILHSPLCILAPLWWRVGLVFSKSWDCCWWSFIKGHTRSLFCKCNGYFSIIQPMGWFYTHLALLIVSRIIFTLFMRDSCELLSLFLSLTHWAQLRRRPSQRHEGYNPLTVLLMSILVVCNTRYEGGDYGGWFIGEWYDQLL